MIAPSRRIIRGQEDYADAAALLAAGHPVKAVAEWTHIAVRELRRTGGSRSPGYIPSPAEIEEGTAAVQATWTETERQRRRTVSERQWTVPMGLTAFLQPSADESDS